LPSHQYLLDTTTTTTIRISNWWMMSMWGRCLISYICQKYCSLLFLLSLIYLPSAQFILEKDLRWGDGWMDAAPDTHFGSSYYAGFWYL
jgi:hypothetical protein